MRLSAPRGMWGSPLSPAAGEAGSSFASLALFGEPVESSLQSLLKSDVRLPPEQLVRFRARQERIPNFSGAGRGECNGHVAASRVLEKLCQLHNARPPPRSGIERAGIDPTLHG